MPRFLRQTSRGIGKDCAVPDARGDEFEVVLTRPSPGREPRAAEGGPRALPFVVVGLVGAGLVLSVLVTSLVVQSGLDTELDRVHRRLRPTEAEVRELNRRLADQEEDLSELQVDRYVGIPNVVGIRFREAKAILQSAGLSTSPDPPDLDGIVVRQHPAPGASVPRGIGTALETG